MDEQRAARLRIALVVFAVVAAVVAAPFAIGLLAGEPAPSEGAPSSSTTTAVTDEPPTSTGVAADGAPPEDVPSPSRPELDVVWTSPRSDDPLAAAESWVTALHTWDAASADRRRHVSALLRWVGEEARDVRIALDEHHHLLTPVEAAEAAAGSEAVWDERRRSQAFSVFSPGRAWRAEAHDAAAFGALLAALERSGQVLVWVEGLRIEVRGGEPVQSVERELVWVTATDAPGRSSDDGGAWVLGTVEALQR